MTTTRLRLHKLHATGNDFLVLDGIEAPAAIDAALARRLCDRRTGIGADGIMTIGAPSEDGSDVSMLLLNADGGRAQMSGNGVRCLARVADERGYARGDELVVDTDAGRRVVGLERDASGVIAAAVDMGSATFDPRAIPVAAESPFDLVVDVGGAALQGDAVGMGNPHFVVPVADPDDIDVARFGAAVEHAALFPDRTNVEFVHRDAPDRIRMRVWERGVGETRSCGTGACAVAAAAYRRELVGSDVTVIVRGGELRVHVGPTVTLSGPVMPVFVTDVDIAALA